MRAEGERAMRFTMPLLRRLFGKLVQDILPAALASLLAVSCSRISRSTACPRPATVPVAPRLARDDAAAARRARPDRNFVKAQIANEKKPVGAERKAQLRATADDPPPAVQAADRRAPGRPAERGRRLGRSQAGYAARQERRWSARRCHRLRPRAAQQSETGAAAGRAQ